MYCVHILQGTTFFSPRLSVSFPFPFPGTFAPWSSPCSVSSSPNWSGSENAKLLRSGCHSSVPSDGHGSLPLARRRLSLKYNVIIVEVMNLLMLLYLFYLMSFIYVFRRAIYFFVSRQIVFLIFWFLVYMLSCFFDFLFSCFSAFLLLCFSVSLRLCFLLSLLLCKFSASLFSLPLCCTSVPFYFCYSTVSFRQSCVFAALLPAPLLPCFLSLLSYYLVVFHFLLLYSFLFVS